MEDVVLALIDSVNVKDYINKMRIGMQNYPKGMDKLSIPLKCQQKAGKQKMNCANTEGIFRIIQSIPSPKSRDRLSVGWLKLVMSACKKLKIRNWRLNGQECSIS